MQINELSELSHAVAIDKGFYDRERPIPELLMLIVSELGEAVEADRNSDWDNFKEEIADAYLRLGDLCAYLKIDIEEVIIKKMSFNKTRPKRHNKKY